MRNKEKSRVFAREQHVSRHVFEDFIQVTEGGGQRSDGISHDDKIALGSVVQEQDDLFRRVSGSEKGTIGSAIRWLPKPSNTTRGGTFERPNGRRRLRDHTKH